MAIDRRKMGREGPIQVRSEVGELRDMVLARVAILLRESRRVQDFSCCGSGGMFAMGACRPPLGQRKLGLTLAGKSRYLRHLPLPPRRRRGGLLETDGSAHGILTRNLEPKLWKPRSSESSVD